MKIAITSQGDNLNSAIDQRFGRCPYLLIVETDGMQGEAVVNPYADESGGVGSRLAGLVADKGAEVVLTGTLGPNAQDALDAAGIRAVLDCAGTVRESVESFKAGHLRPQPAGAGSNVSEADERPGRGRGFGRGREGGGRGRGGGGGRGCGEGRRRRRRRFQHRSESD
ncbi:MAG: NifB/NifX family molybdenum-iron cluster-binding protein [Planctomycetota bacterium]|nr:NifB/NifX family molybdenum-iron cluster-binding protein [Planctomycetota bacterium]